MAWIDAFLATMTAAVADLTGSAAGLAQTHCQAEDDITARRAKAYHEMENSVCEIARMGELAMNCFDDPDEGLFIFAVGHLEWMLQRFTQRYYAMEFPPEN